jgi:hypothetical protein
MLTICGRLLTGESRAVNPVLDTQPYRKKIHSVSY